MLDVSIQLTLETFHLRAYFSLPKTAIVTLFGRSGAGKSTLIHTITGLLKPQTGKIVLHGRTLFDHQRHITLPPWKRHIGCVFQNSFLFPHMSVKDNLLYGWRRQTTAQQDKRRMDALLELLELKSFLKRWPAHLSGGEKQRIILARALLHHPVLLLLDEPLTSLEQPLRNQILPYLAYLKAQDYLPIIYVSHTLDEIFYLGDYFLLMDQGLIVEQGHPNDVLVSKSFRKIYGSQYCCSFFDGVVTEHLWQQSLTCILVHQHMLRLPQIHLCIGIKVRLYIYAKDVILSSKEPTESLSILNGMYAIITGIEPLSEHEYLVFLSINGITIRSLITRYTFHQMHLAPGQTVFVLLKTIGVSQLTSACR